MARVSTSTRLMLAIALGYVISFGGLAYAYTELQEQNERLRYAFCDLQPYAQSAAPPGASPGAVQLRDVFTKITGPQGVQCSPDPSDGK